MRIGPNLTRTYEFACHSAACRPPGSGGTGGSTKGGAAKSGVVFDSARILRAMGHPSGNVKGVASLDEMRKATRAMNLARKIKPTVARNPRSTDAHINVGGKLTPVTDAAYNKWRAAGKPTIFNPDHLTRVTSKKRAK